MKRILLSSFLLKIALALFWLIFVWQSLVSIAAPGDGLTRFKDAQVNLSLVWSAMSFYVFICFCYACLLLPGVMFGKVETASARLRFFVRALVITLMASWLAQTLSMRSTDFVFTCLSNLAGLIVLLYLYIYFWRKDRKSTRCIVTYSAWYFFFLAGVMGMISSALMGGAQWTSFPAIISIIILGRVTASVLFILSVRTLYLARQEDDGMATRAVDDVPISGADGSR